MDKRKVSITAIVRVGTLAILALNLGSGLCFAESVGKRFKDKEKLVYKVSANGIPSGYIEWEYLGKEKIDGKEVEVLSLSSDNNIFNFLSLSSQEKVFLDSSNYLPLRVERDMVNFGKEEHIEEVYNQDEGYVKITRTNDRNKENTLYRDKPIHNILALLYFFPDNIDLQKGEWMTFNLPTQKIKIKFIRERVLAKNGQKYDTYFLLGRGGKRFSLWLDKESRLPLRIDFIFPLGKVIIESKG